MKRSEEFFLEPGLCYLNHAAVSPWPRCTGGAVKRFADENMHQGASAYPEWNLVEKRLRERLKTLINAPASADIALLKNTSEALSTVAYGLCWGAGDNIVGIHADFPSNRVVWESLKPRGVAFVGVDILNSEDPEQALMDACTSNTRLMAVSSVHYATGLRLDLPRLGSFCRRQGIRFCVDAIQSLGAIPFDLTEIEADFVAADGHKWMLGPEGIALFYVRADLREQLKLHQYGWHMVEEQSDYTRLDWSVAGSARRFECGSPNMLGIHGLEASLDLLEETGISQVWSRLQKNINYLAGMLKEIRDVRIISDLESPDRQSGILTFTVEGWNSDELTRQLLKNRVICASRGGGIRFSPHFYTEQETLAQGVETLKKLVV